MGKSKYTNMDGSYGPLIHFYDQQVPGVTFRQAETIPDMDNCRIQIMAAGVANDLSDFVHKSGADSGSLARDLPVIGLDRTMVRILKPFLPSLTVSLQGLKSVLTIIGNTFLFTKQMKNHL